jgi:hypothetical protein
VELSEFFHWNAFGRTADLPDFSSGRSSSLNLSINVELNGFFHWNAFGRTDDLPDFHWDAQLKFSTNFEMYSFLF